MLVGDTNGWWMGCVDEGMIQGIGVVIQGGEASAGTFF